jgi:hypothetical protein
METSALSPDVKNYVMPRGRVSFAQMAVDGTMAGEIDLGNVASLELTSAIQYKEHETSGEAVPILDCKKISNAKYKIKFTPEERSTANMALFFLADGVSRKQQVGSISGSKTAVVYLDRWTNLGYWQIEPGSITVNGIPLASFDSTTYSVDYENGLIMFHSGLADGLPATFLFTYADYSIPMFVPRSEPIMGFLRYRGTNEIGPRYSIKCWKVQISPDAAMAFLKAQDYSGLSFAGDVYEDDDTGSHSANPNFEIVELSEASSYPSPVPSASWSHYPGEEDSPVDVISGNDAVWVGTPAYDTGIVNRCFKCSNSSGLSIDNLFKFNPDGKFTLLDFYYKKDVEEDGGFEIYEDQQLFILYYISSSNIENFARGILLTDSLGNVIGEWDANDIASPKLLAATWYHFIIKYDNGNWYLFINNRYYGLLYYKFPIPEVGHFIEFGSNGSSNAVYFDEIKINPPYFWVSLLCQGNEFGDDGNSNFAIALAALQEWSRTFVADQTIPLSEIEAHINALNLFPIPWRWASPAFWGFTDPITSPAGQIVQFLQVDRFDGEG